MSSMIEDKMEIGKQKIIQNLCSIKSSPGYSGSFTFTDKMKADKRAKAFNKTAVRKSVEDRSSIYQDDPQQIYKNIALRKSNEAKQEGVRELAIGKRFSDLKKYINGEDLRMYDKGILTKTYDRRNTIKPALTVLTSKGIRNATESSKAYNDRRKVVSNTSKMIQELKRRSEDKESKPKTDIKKDFYYCNQLPASLREQMNGDTEIIKQPTFTDDYGISIANLTEKEASRLQRGGVLDIGYKEIAKRNEKLNKIMDRHVARYAEKKLQEKLDEKRKPYLKKMDFFKWDKEVGVIPNADESRKETSNLIDVVLDKRCSFRPSISKVFKSTISKFST